MDVRNVVPRTGEGSQYTSIYILQSALESANVGVATEQHPRAGEQLHQHYSYYSYNMHYFEALLYTFHCALD